MEVVEIDAEGLMRQAPRTMEFYIGRIIEMLDRKFGEGYAAKNPKLVGFCLMACTQDFSAAIACKILEEGVSELVDVLRELIEEMSAAE